MGSELIKYRKTVYSLYGISLNVNEKVKLIRGSGGTAPPLFTFEVDRCERSASHPSYFLSREGLPGIRGIGVWVGPRAGLDVVAKRKTLDPARNLTLAILVLCYID
jgi:hypothetical protein